MPFFVCPRPTSTQGTIHPFFQQLLDASLSQSLPNTTTATTNPSPSSSSCSRNRNQNHPYRYRGRRGFSPNFDVSETEGAYILEGEFPGLSDKESLNIEFADHKTLVVSGKLERAPLEQQQQQADIVVEEVWGKEEKAQSEKENGAVVVEQEILHPSRPSSPHSLNPTVEDTDDEDDISSNHSGFEVVKTPSSTITPVPEKKTDEPKPAAAAAEVKVPVVQQHENQKPKARVWVSERTFGEFQRSFSFPGLVDVENVSASLDAGLLRIVVPKRGLVGPRKVEIE